MRRIVRTAVRSRSAAARRIEGVSFSVERLEVRSLLSGTASIQGTVWDDSNGDSTRNATEAGLADWVVYLDQNRNTVRDPAETWTTTDSAGIYGFHELAAGRYYVTTELKPGWELTFPGLSTAAAQPRDVQNTTTAADAPIFIAGDPVPGRHSGVFPATAQSSSLIRLDALRADPRFAGADGNGSAVAVLDTGVDFQHPAFGLDADRDGKADRIRFQYDFADGDPDAYDWNGHGTNVAGIAVGQDEIFPGMAPGADLIALKVFPDFGAGSFAAVERALQWVVQNAAAKNIVSVNMSLSDSQNWAADAPRYGIGDELAALAAQGVIVVSAAGNGYGQFQSQGVAYPAADPNSLAVGAVYDENVGGVNYSGGATDYSTAPDRIASFSQRSATQLDVFAPGAAITNAGVGGWVSTYSGTSQAAPHVAGLAAVAQQIAVQQLGRRLTPGEFRSLLRDAAVTINDGDDENDSVNNTGLDFPRIDAFALAEAVYNLGPRVHTVDLNDFEARFSVDFGARSLRLDVGQPDLTMGSDTGLLDYDSVTSRDNRDSTRTLTFAVPGTRAGTVVTMYADGVAIGSAAGADGATFVMTTPSVALAEGDRVITATQSDGGITSDHSPALYVTIDVTRPAAPVLELAASSDTGVSNTDHITNDTTPTFIIDAGPDLFYRIQSGTGQLMTEPYATANTFTPPSLADGDYAYRAHAVDVAGNVSASGSLVLFTVDTVAPAPTPLVDGTFGTNGRVTFPDPAGRVQGLDDVDVQADGKVVAVGGRYETTDPNGPMTPLILRLLPDGKPDPSFGDAGWAAPATPAGPSSRFHAVELLPDGKILAAGEVRVSNNGNPADRFLLARFLPDGRPDLSFGADGSGTVVSAFGTMNCRAYDLAVGPGGVIYLSGEASIGSGGDFAVARYLSDGTPDPAFASDGFTMIDLGAVEMYPRLALTPNGLPVVAGASISPTGNRAGVARFLADGTPDPSFDGDGKRLVDVGASQTYVDDVLVQPDGRIVTIGKTLNAAYESLTTLVRYNVDGTLDATFGTGGVAAHDLVLYAEAGYGGVLQADGKIVVTGFANGALLARFNPNGSPDTTFAPGGFTVLPSPPQATALGWRVALAPGGKIVSIGGYGTGVPMVLRHNGSRAPATLTLRPASDTGASASDRLTNDTTPTFDRPGNYFRVYRDGVRVSGAFETGDGDGFTPALPQPDGTAQWTVSSVDAAGNESALSLPLPVTIDTVAPTADVVDVTPDPRTTAVASIQINFSEPVTGFSTAHLRLRRDDGLDLLAGSGATLVGNADGKSFTLTGLDAITTAAGTYTLTFLASAPGVADTAGNSIPTDGDAADTWVVSLQPVTVRASADAYVRDGTYAATNFGNAMQLQVKQGSASYNRESYLRFDLSGVASVGSAKLRLFGRLDNTAAASAGFTVYNSTNTTWSETAVTWNGKLTAAAGGLVAGTVAGTTGKWYEVDLTSFLKTQKANGAAAVTLVLKASAASASTIVFDSDESTNPPQLVVTPDGPPPPPQQGLVVSAASLSVPEGSNASFTVKLATQPTSDVVVTVAKAGGSDADLNTATMSLTFTAANWNVAQTVGITAAEDTDTTNGIASFTLSSAGLTTKSVNATEADNDTPPPPGEGPVTLLAAADAYVRDGTSYAAVNYGTATQMQVKQGSAGYTRQSYLRFDLSSVASVGAAKLRLFGKLDNTSAATAGFTIYDAADVAWGETAINWNNKPAAGTTSRGSGTVAGVTGKWYEVDLTTFLKAQKAAGKTAVTLVLKATAASGATILIDSDEAGANGPQLVVTPDGPPPQGIVVSSSNVSVPEGGTASFTVKLAVQPTSDVVVTVGKASGDADLTTGATTLTFTSANWNVAQTVSVAAAEDADATNGTASFTLSSPGLTGKSVGATEADNDTPPPPAGPVILRAGADAYVRDGTYAPTNYGTATQLQVKQGAAGYTRESYLRFDLSSVSSVSSAKLRLFGKLDNTAAASAGFTVYNSTDLTWSETGVTWNAKPVAGTTARGSGTVSGTTGAWVEVDLTAFLAAEKAAGRNVVTLVLKATAASGSTILFDSDEGANRPELVVS